MTMQPIEKQVHDAFEIVKLENLFEEELKCESGHRQPDNRVCSVEVTHAMNSAHHGDVRVCAMHAERKRIDMNAGRPCLDCMRPAADCWHLRPI